MVVQDLRTYLADKPGSAEVQLCVSDPDQVGEYEDFLNKAIYINGVVFLLGEDWEE